MLQKFDERNRDLIVSVNGRLVHRDRAVISPFDSAVQGGDAVWEGLRLYQGKIFRLAEHLARLRRSAAALAFASVPSDEEITGQIRAALRANEMTDNVHIRLTLTRGVKITSGMDPRLNQSGPTLIVLEGEGMLRMRDYPLQTRESLAEAAGRAGVDIRRGIQTVGASDAPNLPIDYHWPTDTPDSVGRTRFLVAHWGRR